METAELALSDLAIWHRLMRIKLRIGAKNCKFLPMK